MIAPALGQAAGYGVVVGLGIAFAVGMILVTFILRRYNAELQTSEMFNTAGRTVKSGLVGSAVVSSWTWAATLLQSTAMCYRYGVSGPFWYASGATVQILLFATLAIELKRRAPNAHTFLEAIKARYGTAAHTVFMVFALVTNILVSVMLIVGGSATVSALTGMNTVAAIYLLPAGVVAYTLVGGLKATILTDWIHTFILIILVIMFALTTFSTSDVLGSPSAVYDLLVSAATSHPVDGNRDGSYLTMRSREGVIFFVINIVGNFGTVFVDSGFYNKAIAASPVHALPGYILGGLSWFAIPWLTATTLGLSALALEGNPRFPTFPDRMSNAEISAGLVLPYAAVALLGKSGAAATLLIVFMAVTSATSSELIAVSSILTYDLYRTYIKPAASGTRLLYVSHVVVVCYALVIATLSVGLFYAGISMGYLYVLMGVIIGSAVLPAALALTWSGQNVWAASLSPPLGLVVAVVAWLVTAKQQCGDLSLDCTGSNNPMLAGNVVALLAPLVTIPLLTLAFGSQRYDWQSMLAIRQGDDHDMAAQAGPPGAPDETASAEFAGEQRTLARASRISKTLTIVLTLSFLVLWPMPLYGTGYVFSKSFFTGWVAVGILWIFCSFVAVGLFPVFEGRATLVRTCRCIFLDITGKRHSGPALGPERVEEPMVQGGVASKGGDGGDMTPPVAEKL
ncbi:hypothetical protein P8C59_009108 [Phyllachora maydis]|uniref:Urea active transporter n=1 Tax=Phyllachora maydis TaxID=1825666 RepID=A0AAD9ICF3_9PEZI|nr:hypothetical protein P8C59_009108 [Phyllachora maydis]